MLQFNGKDIDMKSRDSSLKVFAGSGTMAAWMPLNARISWPLFPCGMLRSGRGLPGRASSCVSGTNPTWEH